MRICIHAQLFMILVPLILKGVQRWEVSRQRYCSWDFLKWLQDALRAYDLGLAGVVLSNHGGRQLDFARSGIEVLVEVVAHLKEKRGLSFPNEKFQLFVDGGVRRATDVIKAVALGATAGNVSNSVSFFFSENFDNHMGLQLVLDDHFYTRFHLMVRMVLKRPCKYYMFVIWQLWTWLSSTYIPFVTGWIWNEHATYRCPNH